MTPFQANVAPELTVTLLHREFTSSYGVTMRNHCCEKERKRARCPMSVVVVFIGRESIWQQ